MKNLIKTSIILSLLSVTTLYGQDRITKEEKYQKINDLKTIVKYDPLRLLTGEIAFSVERKTGLNTSFEIEFGPTISEVRPFNSDHLGVGQSTSTRSNIGGFASIGYRFYPAKGAFRGIYISPKFKYKLVNTTYVAPYGTTSDFIGDKSQGTFMFNFGIQTWATSNFSFDFYTGLGLGFANKNYAYQTSVYDNQTNTNIYSWVRKSDTYSTLVFNLGVKIGIGFEGKN